MTGNDLERIRASAAEIRRHWSARPSTGIILGTGLGGLADSMERQAEIDYHSIPHFPVSTAIAHRGRLICGDFCGEPTVAMQGRCHLYEGYTADALAHPVRVMAELGIERLIVSNASGGLNPQFSGGDVMLIEGHVNLMWSQPTGIDNAANGPSRRGLSPYCPQLLQRAGDAARADGFTARRGVYVSVAGPNYETRAEYRMFRALGGDAVGMSTVPEVLAAAERAIPVLALSAITNLANPDAPERIDALDVVDAAELAAPKMQAIVAGLLKTVS